MPISPHAAVNNAPGISAIYLLRLKPVVINGTTVIDNMKGAWSL
jgi:hypothetical protein